MNRVRVKVCGIRTLEEARTAVEAGADALGFNLWPRSPRYVSPESAREIVAAISPFVSCVGVFVNEESPDQVRQIATESGITALHLHGDESPDYCHEFADQYVIKALAVGHNFDTQLIEHYHVNAIMLDTKHNTLRGGTGRAFDWSMAQEISKTVPKLFLAGGLSPENVAGAIETVRPYAVDACSSLEDRPGKKNGERMRAFVAAVRSVKP